MSHISDQIIKANQTRNVTLWLFVEAMAPPPDSSLVSPQVPGAAGEREQQQSHHSQRDLMRLPTITPTRPLPHLFPTVTCSPACPPTPALLGEGGRHGPVSWSKASAVVPSAGCFMSSLRTQIHCNPNIFIRYVTVTIVISIRYERGAGCLKS